MSLKLGLKESHLLRTSNVKITRCVSCGRMIESRYLFEKGKIFLIKNCPFDDTKQKLLVYKSDSELNFSTRAFDKRVNTYVIPKVGSFDVTDNEVVNKHLLQHLCFNVTRKCNTNCKICAAGDCNSDLREMDINILKDKTRGFKFLDIMFSGGEPTVHSKLQDFIKFCSEKGFYSRIMTNGLRLADEGYLKLLIDSGLKHVHLSFDGFHEKCYEQVRGGSFELELKLKALNNLKKYNINTTLELVIIKGVNDSEVSKILKFAFENEFICELRFHPLCLTDSIDFPFSEENVFSHSEIKSKLQIASNGTIKSDTFEAYNSLTRHFSETLFKPIFASDNIYLVRSKNGFTELFSSDELRFLKSYFSALTSKDFKFLIFNIKDLKIKYFKMGLLFIKSKFKLFNLENELILSRRFFRINLNYVYTPFTFNFFTPLQCVTYGVDGLVMATQDSGPAP